MRYVGRILLATLAAALTIGCANVKVKKVDVDKRIEGRDHHIRGFRYYLNRPYVIVSKAVTVATRYDPVRRVDADVPDPVTAGALKHVLLLQSLVPDPFTGQAALFDFSGNLVTNAMNLKPFTQPIQGPTAPKQGPTPPALASGDQSPSGSSTTTNTQPTLTGRIPGAKFVQLLDEHSNVIGSQSASDDGTYSVKPDKPLPLGEVQLLVRAVTAAGQGPPSKPLTITVAAPAAPASPAPNPDAALPLEDGPAAPALAPADQDPVGSTTTHNPMPRLTGKIPGAKIVRLLDDGKNVIGSHTASPDGTYEVIPSKPLGQGKVRLHVQPVMENGTKGAESDPVVITVAVGTTTSAPGPGAPASLGPAADNPSATSTGAPASNSPNGGAGGPAQGQGGQGQDQSSQTNVTTTQTTGAIALSSFQVVFLPDFEEQYAIRNKNFLAKTQYKYNFSHGSQLDTFSGSYSAVDVPVAVLETIGTLLSAALPALTGNLQGGGAAGATSGTGTKAQLANATAPQPEFYVKRQMFVEPGVYRLQKSWERVAAQANGAVEPEIAPGLLSDLGLAIQEVSSVLSISDYTKETTTTQTPTPAPVGGQGGGATTPPPVVTQPGGN